VFRLGELRGNRGTPVGIEQCLLEHISYLFQCGRPRAALLGAKKKKMLKVESVFNMKSQGPTQKKKPSGQKMLETFYRNQGGFVSKFEW